MNKEAKQRIELALDDLRAGRPVVVVDDADRENEGDLVMSAQHVRAEDINFMSAEARGLICIAMTGEDLDRLGIPMMVPGPGNGTRFESPFTISVEAATGVTTGISAPDRARTARVLADPSSGPTDVSMPGHLFPLRARPEGLLARRGHTEAGVDLMRMAGLRPAAVICEIMDADGTMARRAALEAFTVRHGLRLLSIEDLVDYRRHTGAFDGAASPAGNVESDPIGKPSLVRVATTPLPTRWGPFEATAYRDAGGSEHLLLRRSPVSGDGCAHTVNPAPIPASPDRHDGPLVRVHSECLTGDALGSLRCDCGEQLDESLRRIAEDPAGMLIYLRQEGRGIGLANKIRAYVLQDEGMDTVEANICLGFRPDHRDYSVAGAILHDQGVSEVRLLTNNPAKIDGLESLGITVAERIPLTVSARPENIRYLRTKAKRMKHILDADPHHTD